MGGIDFMTSVSFVVRGSGERTENNCLNICQSNSKDEKVFLVQEKPFSKALTKSLEIGLDVGSDWTFIVDADVLLGRNVVYGLIDYLSTLPDDVFVVLPEAIDKAFGFSRIVGLHLYRTCFLEDMLKMVINEEHTLRPESTMIKKFMDLGYERQIYSKPVGIHDFEQYNKDLYRKGFLHVRKHGIPYYLDYLWKNMSNFDDDYHYLLMGLNDSQTIKNYVSTNIDDYNVYWSNKNLVEKEDLNCNTFTPEYIDYFINNYKLPNHHFHFCGNSEDTKLMNKKLKRKHFIKDVINGFRKIR